LQPQISTNHGNGAEDSVVLKLTLGIYVNQLDNLVREVRDCAGVQSCFGLYVIGDVLGTFSLFKSQR
jgi:hypothetical protein